MMKDEDASESSSSSAGSGIGGGGGGENGESGTLETLIERKPAPTAIRTGRSCTGCLYHSSYRTEHGRNPLCVGFSRSEKKTYHVENPHLNNEKMLLEFKYACLGYSVYKQNAAGHERRVELPACIGIEMQVLDPSKTQHRRQTVPSQLSHGAEAHEHQAATTPAAPRPPPPPPPRPEIAGPARGDEFATRFFRTAGLIAAAVGHNLSRVAGSIKTGLDDIFYPDRRRPK